ncbi:Ribosomal RNA large subunit methyltransferase A [hydrothermal vent metagenome]|uniref:Ribosomal RNA large subunit methyltransferase A n=1 Tax=hydrothermal vent metagenome TaxID=652676 RepID=A0A3B0ZRU5_9ZZZZ
MLIKKVSNLACPIDGEQLKLQAQQLVCNNGHTFDIARQGYVNLLPVQQKRSKEPGDSKDMVVARTQFLNDGFYTPVVDKLAEIIQQQIKPTEQICLLDAGCGEGYYLDAIAHLLESVKTNNTLAFIGLDISKPAIVAAAKRSKKITWVVGTNRQPPVCAASVDIILCVFGFQSLDGFSYALKPGGKVILVEPGPEHLQELRQVIYADVKNTESPGLPVSEGSGFSLIDNSLLKFKTGEINQQQINNLLLMTPHFYRASKNGKEAASQLQSLNLSIDMVLTVYEKTAYP